MRRTSLRHALLSNGCGEVIVALTINAVAAILGRSSG